MKRYLPTIFPVFCIAMAILCVGTAGATENPRETPVVKVVRQNSTAVVNIATERIFLLRERPLWGPYDSEFDLLFRQFYDLYAPVHALKLKSVGSGVIVDKTGVIITNAHVVHMASSLYVILNDGTSVPGQVRYIDADNDLAVITIDPPGHLTQVVLGKADDIIIGETVVAIGNPLGLENSVTAGIVSGKNRELRDGTGVVILDGLIQVDAPINPGNSGGGLLNLAGELIGINVAVVQNSQSIGFAIPIATVRKVLEGYKRNRELVVKQKSRLPQTAGGNASDTGPAASPQPGEGWNPSEELDRMRGEMNRLFQDVFRGRDWQSGMGAFRSDVGYDAGYQFEETPDSYVMKFDVKGMDKDKIDIEVNEGSLTITGEYSLVNEDAAGSGAYREEHIGSFSRTVPIPQNVDVRGVTTKIEEGTLIITLPKA